MFRRLIGSVVLLLALAAPGQAKPINIKIVQTATSSAAENRAVDYLSKLIEERTGGRMQIRRLPEADSKKGLKTLQTQQAQLALLNSASLRQELPLLQLFELPFLFAGREQLHKVLDSKIGRQILAAQHPRQLKPLAYWDKSFRQLVADRPLLSPLQARGLHFHNQQSLLAAAVNGQDNENFQGEQIIEVSLSELTTVQSNAAITDLTLSNHAATGDLLLTSQVFWDHLPEDLKVIVRGAIHDTTVYVRELMARTDKLARQQQQKNNRFRIHQLTPEQRSVWQNTMIQLYRKHFSGNELQFIEKILHG